MDELKYQIVLKVLCLAKKLVHKDLFELVPRQSTDSMPVPSPIAKLLFSQVKVEDYHSREEDHDRPNEFVWIFHEKDDDITYYIKFKLLTYSEAVHEGFNVPIEYENTTSYCWVKFISFHESNF